MWPSRSFPIIGRLCRGHGSRSPRGISVAAIPFELNGSATRTGLDFIATGGGTIDVSDMENGRMPASFQRFPAPGADAGRPKGS